MSLTEFPISMDFPSVKGRLRQHFRQVRDQITAHRREQARVGLFSALQAHLEGGTGHVLSFSTMGSEIATDLLNRQLRDRLLLPPDDFRDLIGVQLGLVIVPGLAFDACRHRLGYGRAYYDRLLAFFPGVRTVGIGFTEQQHSEGLPVETHDVPLDDVVLL